MVDAARRQLEGAGVSDAQRGVLLDQVREATAGRLAKGELPTLAKPAPVPERSPDWEH